MPKDGVKRETAGNGMNGTGRDKDPRWQIAALLAQRSAVRDALAVGVGLRWGDGTGGEEEENAIV